MNRRTGLAMAVLAALLAAPAAGFGQIIENSAGPAARDAGRVLKLAEVWRINDDAEKFFLHYPNNLQIAADGSIFLTDSPGELLKFSPDGEFLENLFKVGQGPGELGKESGPAFRARGHDLYIFDIDPPRIWRADLAGHFQEGFKVPPSDMTRFAGVLREGLLFWTITFPPREGRTEGKFVDLPQILVLVPWEAGKRRDIATVMTRTFVSPLYALPDQMSHVFGPDGKSLFFAVAGEYLVQELDLVTGAVVRKFRRPYSRVPLPPYKPRPMSDRAREILKEQNRKGYSRPRPAYRDDIWLFGFAGERLWVVTSMDDDKKGLMIDVFDKGGLLTDSFHLGKGRKPIGLAEGVVFCAETGPDDKVSVVKYRVVK